MPQDTPSDLRRRFVLFLVNSGILLAAGKQLKNVVASGMPNHRRLARTRFLDHGSECAVDYHTRRRLDDYC